jgi:hypothetical protein
MGVSPISFYRVPALNGRQGRQSAASFSSPRGQTLLVTDGFAPGTCLDARPGDPRRPRRPRIALAMPALARRRGLAVACTGAVRSRLVSIPPEAGKMHILPGAAPFATAFPVTDIPPRSSAPGCTKSATGAWCLLCLSVSSGECPAGLAYQSHVSSRLVHGHSRSGVPFSRNRHGC